MTHEDVEMEIFRSGSYGDKGTWSDADLQQIADDYRAELLEAPLTFDHAQVGPAYGWVSRIRREGDRLVAALKGVPDTVRQLVRSGAYKRRSVELFRKLPQTGRPYLRAVSLLGAATPEVKGLRDVCFSADAESTAVEFADCTAPATDGVNAPAGPSPAATEAADHADAQMNDLQARLRDAQFTAFFAELRADGYCLSRRDADAIRQLFPDAGAADATVAFHDGSTAAGFEWLGSFLREKLMKVPAQQVATLNAAPQFPAGTNPVAFSERTLPQSMELHQRATALREDTPGLSYRDALTMASRMGAA